MSYAGIVFMFVFLDNVTLTAFFGLGEAIDRSGARWIESAGILTLSSIAGLIAGFSLWLLSLIGADFAATWLTLVLTFGLCLGIERAARRIIPGVSARLKDSIWRIESSGIVYAIGIIVSGVRLDPLRAFVAGIAAALGHFAAVFILRRIMNRLSLEAVPSIFKGIPILLISAGLMALAFSALDRSFLGGVLP